MGSITIANLDQNVISGIQRRAAEHGLSMEEEIRRLLTSVYSSVYSTDRQLSQREWAERQLERLRRGELPRATTSSVDTIREMREERDQQLMDAIEGRTGRHR